MHLRQLHVKIGMCSLNCDALDFTNNFKKIYRSIKYCKELNCTIRVGGELEIPGYGCYDHYLEYDTIYHSWDVIKDIIVSGITNDIVVELGCPILHKSALYNGRVVIYNGKVVGIRVKTILADGGSYFETRHFAFWKDPRQIGDFSLPLAIQEVTGQSKVPIGVFIIQFKDTTLGYEICEEAWISNNPMIDAALDGCEIFLNPSASYIERGKLKRKLAMIEEFTERHGGAYLYVNARGMLGDRIYFDGCSMYSENGKVKELAEPFSLDDVSVTPVIVNINAIRTFRINKASFQKESHGKSKIPMVEIDKSVACNCEVYLYESPKHIDNLKRKYEIYCRDFATYESALYLWDILRKSGARGFYLPISGGLDSCSVGVIVFSMCWLLTSQIRKEEGDWKELLQDLRRILRQPQYLPKNAKQLCNRVLFTAYLQTKNSSEETRNRAASICESIGCKHRVVNFDSLYTGYSQIANTSLGIDVKFHKQGGSHRTDLALQNIQSRSRMVLTYFMASLELEKQNLQGFLLVLGSSNLDEALRGYYTKYDCSSADYNPIGSFSKRSLKKLLIYFQKQFDLKVINEVMDANPSAELRPLLNGEIAQTDEQDMGLTYEELHMFGYLRKVEKLGPVSMFDNLYFKRFYDNPKTLAAKVKHFFKTYAQNRHKVTTLPPSFHYDPENCDDNRFDMRPHLYKTDWSYQMNIIDERVKDIQNNQGELIQAEKELDLIQKKKSKLKPSVSQIDFELSQIQEIKHMQPIKEND